MSGARGGGGALCPAQSLRHTRQAHHVVATKRPILQHDLHEGKVHICNTPYCPFRYSISYTIHVVAWREDGCPGCRGEDNLGPPGANTRLLALKCSAGSQTFSRSTFLACGRYDLSGEYGYPRTTEKAL